MSGPAEDAYQVSLDREAELLDRVRRAFDAGLDPAPPLKALAGQERRSEDLGAAALREAAADAWDLLNSAPEEPGHSPNGAVMVPLADVVPRRVRWLWHLKVARGKVTVLDGDPNVGKSTITLDLAARVSTGEPMPDGTPGMSGETILLSAEDDLADTIRPRLDAARADVSRITAFHAVRIDQDERLPELPEDLARLELAIESRGAVLLIVDPLMAFLGRNVDAHRDQDVRRALAPLTRLAERTEIAVVVVRHLNKGGSGNPLYRGGGSIGIIGAARAGLLAARDPDDDSRRVLAVTKQNLAAAASALAYRLVEAPNGVAVIEWLGETDHTAATLLAVPTDGHVRSALEEAKDFLREELATGPVPTKDLMKTARAAGIADATLQRARQAIRVRSHRKGFGPGGTHFSELPGLHAGSTPPMRAQTQGLSEHDEHGAQTARDGDSAGSASRDEQACDGGLAVLPVVRERRLLLTVADGVELWLLEGPGPERRWQLRRDGEVLAETAPEDHVTANVWIAAIQDGRTPEF